MCCFKLSIHTLRLSVGGQTDGRMDGRTHGRTENIYSIFRDKLLLPGEHGYLSTFRYITLWVPTFLERWQSILSSLNFWPWHLLTRDNAFQSVGLSVFAAVVYVITFFGCWQPCVMFKQVLCITDWVGSSTTSIGGLRRIKISHYF